MWYMVSASIKTHNLSSIPLEAHHTASGLQSLELHSWGSLKGVGIGSWRFVCLGPRIAPIFTLNPRMAMPELRVEPTIP